MKYLISFNEATSGGTWSGYSPDKYRMAANYFRKYGRSQTLQKAANLEDWADKKEFGLYNMHFVTGVTKVITGSFTRPKLIGMYYGNTPPESATDPQYSEFYKANNLLSISSTYLGGVDNEEKAEQLVDKWVRGNSELSITFEFGLRPTNETIIASKNHSYLTGTNRGGRYVWEVPCFSIKLLLSDWEDGLEGYDYEWKEQCEEEGDDYTPTSISDFFQNTSYNEWTIDKPLSQYYSALFSDRKSSEKFLAFFRETMQSEKVQDAVMDIFRIVGARGDLLNELYKKVKIHGLFDREPVLGGKSYNKLWFPTRID